MSLLLAFLAVAAGDPSADAERWARKAKPVSVCDQAADCDAKWNKGREWIRHNSRFQIAVDKPDILSTYGAMYPSLDLAFVIVRKTSPAGRTTISARAWCGNMFACAPKPRSALEDLAKAMN